MRIKGYTIIHRKYPSINWEFKAISTRIIDDDGKAKDVVYGIVIDNGKKGISIEVYSGMNYIVGSSDKSYSRAYSLSNLPSKYSSIVTKASAMAKTIEWSNAERVSLEEPYKKKFKGKYADFWGIKEGY